LEKNYVFKNKDKSGVTIAAKSRNEKFVWRLKTMTINETNCWTNFLIALMKFVVGGAAFLNKFFICRLKQKK
jgi:hypothetical protein